MTDASHIEVIAAGPSSSASAFDVDGVLVETFRRAVAAIDQLGALRGVARPARTIDRDHLLAYCTTTVHIDRAPMPAWAELSGVYATAGGRQLQAHRNFPQHADGVVARLGCEPTKESVAAAMAERDAFELEAELISDGMIGAVVRTLDEWDEHPHAAATHDLPLTSTSMVGDASPLAAGAGTSDAPLAGVRVVDCSRVLAGPVAGSMLADGGADVVRGSADHLPSVPIGVVATGFGKRNASIDLRTPEGRAAMDDLLGDAEVFIDAYRPGALAAHGYSPERVAELRPGIVVVQISAFDWVGPWAGRRGFDSIVQTTTGVRHAGGAAALGGDGSPIGLPVQALDYATGFLAVALAGELLARQRTDGGSLLGRTSLLRTRDELVSRSGPRSFTPAAVAVPDGLFDELALDEAASAAFGGSTVRAVRPLVGAWRSAPRALGTSPAHWAT
mgnify:CR=1 FL=1